MSSWGMSEKVWPLKSGALAVTSYVLSASRSSRLFLGFPCPLKVALQPLRPTLARNQVESELMLFLAYCPLPRALPRASLGGAALSSTSAMVVWDPVPIVLPMFPVLRPWRSQQEQSHVPGRLLSPQRCGRPWSLRAVETAVQILKKFSAGLPQMQMIFAVAGCEYRGPLSPGLDFRSGWQPKQD